jgi:hypothetical protein
MPWPEASFALRSRLAGWIAVFALLPQCVDQGDIDYKDQRENHTQDALGGGKQGYNG